MFIADISHQFVIVFPTTQERPAFAMLHSRKTDEPGYPGSPPANTKLPGEGRKENCELVWHSDSTTSEKNRFAFHFFRAKIN